MCERMPDTAVEPEASWEWPGWWTAVIVAVVVGLGALLLGLFTKTPLWVTGGILGGIALGILAATIAFLISEPGFERWRNRVAELISIAVGIIGVILVIWLGKESGVRIGTHVATPILFAVTGTIAWIFTLLVLTEYDADD